MYCSFAYLDNHNHEQLSKRMDTSCYLFLLQKDDILFAKVVECVLPFRFMVIVRWFDLYSNCCMILVSFRFAMVGGIDWMEHLIAGSVCVFVQAKRLGMIGSWNNDCR